MDAQLKFELSLLVVVLILARIFYLIHKITTGYSRKSPKKRTTPCKTLICIGSGGHTTEMVHLLKNLDFTKYSPRTYILASSDITSRSKVDELERSKVEKYEKPNYSIISIPRSRIVNQSYFTSVFTTLFSTIYSFPILVKIRPELILCNGPGTCIPICGLGFLLKVLFIVETRIVFIESFCRTETFSLSGKILMYFADNFVVQWPSLNKKLKRSEYIGQLI